MNKILPIYSILFLLIISIAFAATSYNQSGSDTGEYSLGTGFFNEQLLDTQIFTKTLTDSRLIPLINDLDNNGINEIVILDDDTIEIYQNKELDLIAGFTLQLNARTSNMIIFDVDGDSDNEIIITTEETGDFPRIYILGFNGTDLINESSFKMSGTGSPNLDHSNGEVMVACRATNDCLMAYANKITGTDEANAAGEQFVTTFNSTGFGGAEVLIDTVPSGTTAFCYPKIQNIVTNDYDNDGDVDYIFTNFELAGSSAGFRLNIYYIDVDGVTPSESRQELALDDVTGITRTGSSCQTDNYGRFITSPLVFDLDAGKSGKETVVGFNINNNEFKMHSYDASGSTESAAFIDDYPETFDATGEIVSNPMRANVFSDTGNQDFCVLGIDPDDTSTGCTIGCIDLLCASEATSSFLESLEFKFNTDGSFNLTQDYDEWTAITHSGKHSTAQETIGDPLFGNFDPSNPDEFINSYGVFKIQEATFNGSSFVKTLTRIFATPRDNAVIIANDLEKEVTVGGREDLLLLTDTNIFYVDDKFTNSPATISAFTIQPCIDATWKLNTTVQVTITPTDVDNDNVAAKATLYLGDTNEQDVNFSINVSSGTAIPFGDFIANKTIGVGTLRLQARDTQNVAEVDIVDVVFSVGTNGVSFGECTTTVDLDAEAAAISALNLSADAIANQAIVNFVEETSNVFKISPIVLVLLLMLGWTIAVLTTKGDSGSESIVSMNKVIFMVVGNIFILLVAIIAGAISFAVLLTIAVLAIVIIGLWVSRMFHRGAAEG